MKAKSPDGGIGRRTRFRCERSRIHGSSSLLLGTMLCVLFAANQLASAHTSAEKISKNSTVTKTKTSSDEMSIDLQQNTYILNGNAVVEYTTSDKLYKFSAQRITIKCKSNNINDIQKIEASNNILFCYNDLEISAKTCIFDTKTIIFNDNVTIKNNDTLELQADQAIYNMKTQQIDITSKSKVNITIQNEQLAKHKTSKSTTKALY